MSIVKLYNKVLIKSTNKPVPTKAINCSLATKTDPLYKSRYLSEFETPEEKELALQNLGMRKDHSSYYPEFGKATEDKYGHVKLADNIDEEEAAASTKLVKEIYEKVVEESQQKSKWKYLN